MAYSTPIVSTSASGNAGVTTSGIDTTGADLIVVSVSWYIVDTPIGSLTFSDSKSNTWTRLTDSTGGGVAANVLYYCQSPTVGSGHTFTTNGAYVSVCVAAFSGSTSSPFDVQNGSGAAGGAGTIQPGSITPTVDNELVMCGFCGGAGTSPVSIDGGFTKIVEEPVSSSFGGAIAYLIQTTAAAANPTWTLSASGSSKATRIASFKAAAGGTTLASWYYYQHLQCGNPQGF